MLLHLSINSATNVNYFRLPSSPFYPQQQQQQHQQQ